MIRLEISFCPWNLNIFFKLTTSMSETKFVADNFVMLVTVLAVFVTNILYHSTLASGTNVQKMSPISKFCHQHTNIVTNIKLPPSTGHQHLCSHQTRSYYDRHKVKRSVNNPSHDLWVIRYYSIISVRFNVDFKMT